MYRQRYIVLVDDQIDLRRLWLKHLQGYSAEQMDGIRHCSDFLPLFLLDYAY
jgi:hypothetical protein